MDEKDDDIKIEESDLDDSVVAEEHAQDTVKKLREKLKEAETKAKEYLDGWQRAQADFTNLRRRDEEAKIEFIKYANLSLVTELIPVLDSLNMALVHGNKDVKPVYDQLYSVLKQQGLEEINPLDEIFDPKYHETVGAIQADNSEQNNKILEVIQKGYKLIGKIIRPAKVKIGEYHG